jgi:hypothetical protein
MKKVLFILSLLITSVTSYSQCGNTDFELGRTQWFTLEEKQAFKLLTVLETRYRKTIKGQTLLVDIDDIKQLKEAYPNYFMDTKMLKVLLEHAVKVVDKLIESNPSSMIQAKE